MNSVFTGIFILFSFLLKTEFELKPLLELPSLSYPLFLDYNRDGKDEVIRKAKYHDKDCFIIYEQNGNVVAQVNPMGDRAGFVGMANIDGTGNDEAIFWALRKDKLYLFIYNLMDSRGWLYPLFEVKDTVLPKGWDGGILPYGLYPLYKNRELKDIIFFITTGFDMYPRGIFCFNVKEKKIKWKLWIGPPVNDWEVTDMNGDGKDEILISTSAPCNGALIRDENDCTSYLYLVDLNGNLIWKREIGGFGSHIRAEISKDKKIFAVEIQGSRESGEKKKIVCVDGKKGKIIKEIELPLIFTGFSFFDINRDTKKEIIVSTSKNKIIVFNQNLEKIKVIENEYSGKLCRIIDLDGDGNYEIITEREGKLYILNLNFEKIGERDIESFTFYNFPLYRLCKNEGKYLIPLWTKERFLILDFEKQKRINPFPIYTFLGIIFLFLSFYSGFLIARKTSKPPYKTSLKEQMLINLIYEFIHEVKNSISFMRLQIEKKKFGEEISKEITRIYETLASLTDFLKLHKSKPEKININKIISEIVERFKKIKEDIEWDIKMEKELPEIKANRTEFEMCIKNIIENAVQFTDNGKIYVGTRILREPHKKFIEIEIKDTGKGIEEKFLNKTFEPFFTTREEHMGLGLYFSKYIIGKMNGEIKIKSKKGIGTAVFIKLLYK